jgi:hypothetical protein
LTTQRVKVPRDVGLSDRRESGVEPGFGERETCG